jgi:hypothetical protein
MAVGTFEVDANNHIASRMPQPGSPTGSQMTRVFTLDEHGCEIGWFSIDSGDPSFAPQAEHPDRDVLGWSEGISQPFSFYNNVDESWACPSEDAAIFAALLEHATRLDEGWFETVNDCCVVA